jgi:hypothetical protein
MKKITIFLFLLMVTTVQLFAQKVQIKNNKVVSDIRIKLTDNNTVLPNDVIFTLEEYGMKANNVNYWVMEEMTNVSGAMKGFSNRKLISYDILITNPRFSKPITVKSLFLIHSSKTKMIQLQDIEK